MAHTFVMTRSITQLQTAYFVIYFYGVVASRKPPVCNTTYAMRNGDEGGNGDKRDHASQPVTPYNTEVDTVLRLEPRPTFLREASIGTNE